MSNIPLPPIPKPPIATLERVPLPPHMKESVPSGLRQLRSLPVPADVTWKLRRSDFHAYEVDGVKHIITQKDAMLWLFLGAGKTITTLTAFLDMKRLGLAKKMLVIAPLRVCELQWEQEMQDWEHTQDQFKFAKMIGSAKKRQAALFSEADIYMVNYESLDWLAIQLQQYFIEQETPIPFDVLVFDEVSKMKREESARFKAFAEPICPHFQRRIGLTASPASNGATNLWGQFYCLDGGQRLGTDYKMFTQRFFKKLDGEYGKYVPHEAKPFMTGDTMVQRSSLEMIVSKIADMTLEVPAEGNINMKPLTVMDITVTLPPKRMKQYLELEREFFIELDNGTEVEVFNRASLGSKLLQFCIAEDTEVLTCNGWIPIQQVTDVDRLWDGNEWVTHGGLLNNGIKVVVDCWGVFMTDDHEVLTDDGWHTAQEILNEQPSNRFNRSDFQLPHGDTTSRVSSYTRHNQRKSSVVVPMRLWQRGKTAVAKSKISNTIHKIMRMSASGINTNLNRFARYGWYSPAHFVEEYVGSVRQPQRQGLPELRGSGYHLRTCVEKFRCFLAGHGDYLHRSTLYRAIGQHGFVYQSELSMGDSSQTSQQSQRQRSHTDTVGSNDSSTSSLALRAVRTDDIQADKLRLGRGGLTFSRQVSGERNDPRWRNAINRSLSTVRHSILHPIQALQERGNRGEISSPPTDKVVYDIQDVGSRNRYAVRNPNGFEFIVHNCNGMIYNYPDERNPEYRTIEPIHTKKYEALDDIIQDAGDEPIFLVYNFTSERDEIMRKYPHARCMAGLNEEEAIETQALFNTGNLKLLLTHPLSAGYGLNLQHACSIVVWFGMNYNLELYEQTIGRIHRQGQKKPVRCYRILAKDTMDRAVADSLADKDKNQSRLKTSMNAYRKRKGM